MAAEPPPLATLEAFEREAHRFAAELSDTVHAVAGDDCTKFVASTVAGMSEALIRQDSRPGIPLTRGGAVLLRLEVRVKLGTDSLRRHLRVIESQFRVFAEGGRLPLLRYEYDDAMEAGQRPAAHMQFHGSHPDLAMAIENAGRSTTRSSSKSAGPDVADLHMPVGGTRFRPCLEDLLEMLIREFNIDPCPDRASAFVALAAGRRRWRELQLRTAIRDNPGAAVDQLRAMGFDVAWRQTTQPPGPRLDRLTAL